MASSESQITLHSGSVVGSSTHLLMGTWVVSILWLLQILFCYKYPWTNRQNPCFQSFWVYIQNRIAGSYRNSTLCLLRRHPMVSTVTKHLCLLSSRWMVSCQSTLSFSRVLASTCLFFSPNVYKVTPGYSWLFFGLTFYYLVIDILKGEKYYLSVILMCFLSDEDADATMETAVL